MPYFPPGHLESRARIGIPVIGVVLSVNFLLVGLLADFEPRMPDGELVTGTVYMVVPDTSGRPDYVAVRAVTSQGTVTCGMADWSFPDDELPELDARIPVAWTPGYCAWGEPEGQVPRWFFFLVSGAAAALTCAWIFRRRIRAPRKRSFLG